MLRRRSGARPRSRGQAVVEFALVLPVLLLLTVGVVDLTRVFTGYIAITNGVRESVIYAITPKYAGTWPSDNWCSNPPGAIACPPDRPATGHDTHADPDNIAARMEGETRGLDQSKITLSAPVCKTSANATIACSDATAFTVTVGASYQMPILTPILGQILGGHVTVSSSAVGRIMK